MPRFQRSNSQTPCSVFVYIADLRIPSLYTTPTSSLFSKVEHLVCTTMGMMSIASSPPESSSPAHRRVHRAFLLCNYVLLGAASSCIFLTLSLRLFPSLSGFLLILLHALTIAAAVAGCAAASSSSSGSCYGPHMVATVLAAILEGAVAVVAFSRTADFLAEGLRSYVKEEDGVVIVRMVGALCVVIFCMEWVVMALAFVLRYYAYVDGDGNVAAMRRSTAEVQLGKEDKSNWPWPFQV
ncbi:hypothetical protein Cni_G06113 [Canna indica]|uniref:Uncharacterized protein n=1 Tax=Canna indica TaxID=4628 RepID=A0AAQ3Q5M9_9LILI|nr:hypothetical protein Cni_G06113 [Canna indica]